MNIDKQSLIQQLVDLLTKGNAHVTFEKAIENIAFSNIGVKPLNLPYTIWMMVEHLRIAQADIVDFSINPKYEELNWPDDYWPKEDSPKDENEWKNSLDQIFKDRQQFIGLLNQPGIDLLKPFTHGNGQNLLREALLIADHNSYHVGQIVVIRKALNDWHN